ncbi:MAG TPA: hypothetical protein VFN44_23345 [Solirubrobacteraceae bacterium]|nr:hypothetical protein [Solirubrobacteraceae bacterium]
MIAKLSTYANVDLDLADRVKAWMDTEGAGIYDRIPGYRGSLTLVDRDNARMVGIGFYATAGLAAEAEAMLAEIYAEGRERLPASIRGVLDQTPESVGLFEVAHRD